MLTAYFDETNTHEGGEVVLIAGFIADAGLWDALEMSWREILSNVRIPYFHAVECETADGIFSSLARPFREGLFRGLAKVICNYKPTAINAALFRSDWNCFKSGIIGARYESPYHFCFEHCMQIVSTWSRTYGKGEPVRLVFGEQLEYRSRAEVLHKEYRRTSPWRKELGSLAFLPATKYPALQAADLLAYETQRYATDKYESRNSPLRPAMQLMVEGDVHVVGGYYDAAALAILQLHSPVDLHWR